MPVRLCADQAEYFAESDSWQPGTPFPLLNGPALARYRRLFSGGDLPDVEQVQRVGRIVSVGSELSRAAGRLLAVATARTQRHLAGRDLLAELTELPDDTVVIVALTDDLADVVDWPGVAAPRVGLLVGRSAQALACLIYRCLTVAAAPADDRFFVATNPLAYSVDDAAVTLSELNDIRHSRARLLAIHAPGRECSSSLFDSVLCGRAEPVGIPMNPEPGLRATPCLNGEGCFRTDLDESEILRAADVNAVLIYLHSCSSIAIGAHAYPYGVSVALGLLEGTSVAVIGVRGISFIKTSGEWHLEEGLAAGLPLGEIVRQMSAGSEPVNGVMSQFGLLGDPGMVMPWKSVGPARPTSRRSRPKPLSPEAFRRLVVLGRDVVPRLERLRWLGLGVPDEELLKIRRRIREVTAVAYEGNAELQISAIEEKLARVQRAMIERHLRAIFRSGWSFIGPGYAGFSEVADQSVTCSECDRARASVVVMRHRIEPDLYIQALHCRRCGVPWWTTEPGQQTAVVGGPVDVHARRGEICYFDRKIHNVGADILRGAVGYTFRHQNRGLPAPEWTESCEIEPGTIQHFRPPLDLKINRPQRDTHTAPFIGLLNGIYIASAALIQVE